MILPTVKSGFVLFFLLQGILSAPQEPDVSETENEETLDTVNIEKYGETGSVGGFGGAGGRHGGRGRGGAGGGMGGGMEGGSGMASGIAGGMAGGIGGGMGGGMEGGMVGGMGVGMGGGMASGIGGGRSGSRGSQGPGSSGYSSSMSLSGGSGSRSNAMNLIIPGMTLGGGRSGVMDLVGAMGNMAVRGIEAGHDMGTQGMRTAADMMTAFPRALADLSSTGQNVGSLSIPGFSMNMQQQGQQPGYSLNSLALQGLPSYTISSQALQGPQPSYNTNINLQSLYRQMPSTPSYSDQQSGSDQTGNGLSNDQIVEKIGSFGNTVGQGVQQMYSNVPSMNRLSLTSTDSGNSGSSTGINGYTLTIPSGVSNGIPNGLSNGISNGISNGASLLTNLGSSFFNGAKNFMPQVSSVSSGSSGSSGSSSGMTISSYSNLLPQGFSMKESGNKMQLMNAGKEVATFTMADFYNEMNKSNGNIIQAFMNMMSNGAIAISSGMSDIWSAFTSGINNLWGSAASRIHIPILGF